jgi:hypothetical protein
MLLAGVFSAGLSSMAACNGAITDTINESDGKTSGPNDPGGGGSNGGDPSGPPKPGQDILPPPKDEPACESKEFTPARLWRLTDDQYLAAVKDLLPGVEPKTILTPGRSAQVFIDFQDLYDIGPATASDIRTSVTGVASDAVKNVDALLACKGGEDANACAGRFVDGFASRAFRRPLEGNEKSGLLALYTMGAGVSKAEGVRMVISAVLQSASFLYRTELGKTNNLQAGETTELTPHEMASSLSFLLLNSIPDAELRAAADDGSIVQKDKFKAQVERLLKLPRVQDNLTVVYQKWVGLGLGINSDLAVQESEFTPALKTAMEQESKLFFTQMLNGGTITDLFTSNKGFVDKTLGTHLGVQGPASGFGPVNYPAAERSGVLTLPAVVARYSVGHAEVFRGKFVRDEILCTEIPPPPNIPEIEDETEAAKNLPPREQSMRRLANGTCGACHAMMDPIGLSFGNFDALARYRTSDKNGPIDATGELKGAGSDADGPLKNVMELGQRLAKSSLARGCVEQKMFGYALGRLTENYDSCEMKKIDSYLTAGGGKLSDLMAAIVYSSAFRYRTGGK